MTIAGLVGRPRCRRCRVGRTTIDNTRDDRNDPGGEMVPIARDRSLPVPLHDETAYDDAVRNR